MRRRVRWHDRRNESSSGSALRLVRTSSARLRRNRWNGSSNESGTLREGPRASASRRQWKNWPPICGAGAAISASAKRPGVNRSHSLGPTETAGRFVAANGKLQRRRRAHSSQMGSQSGLPGIRPVAVAVLGNLVRSRALSTGLSNAYSQIARYAHPCSNRVSATSRTACTDLYARWCGRGGAARLPPIPIAATFGAVAHRAVVLRGKNSSAIGDETDQLIARRAITRPLASPLSSPFRTNISVFPKCKSGY